MPEYLHISTHEFKTKISKYIRLLERGEYKGIVLCRYKEPVALMAALKKRTKPDQQL